MDDDGDARRGKVCDNLVGKTLKIQRSAMVTIAKPSPDNLSSSNPVLLKIRAWEEPSSIISDERDDYHHNILWSVE